MAEPRIIVSNPSVASIVLRTSTSTTRWEDFESSFASAELRRTLGDLAYPSSDCELLTLPRKSRSNSSVSLSETELRSTYMKNINHYFKQDYSVLKLTKDQPERPAAITEAEFPERVNEITAEQQIGELSLSNFITPKDFHIPGSFTSSKNDRTSLFRAAHIPEAHFINLKPKSAPFESTPSIHEFLLYVKELSFSFGQTEPFFCTIALYNALTAEKVSEDFHFELNSKDNLALVQGKEMDPIWESKFGVFSIDPSHRNSSLYLVLIINKCCVGDLEDSYDVYTKGKDVKDKDRSKFIAENNEFCAHLNEFRQNFAWSAIPLFKDDGSLIASGDIRVDNIQRIKTDLASFLEETLKSDKKEKDKKPGLLGQLVFSFKPINPSSDAPLTNRVTTSLSEVEPFMSNFSERIREIASFSHPDAQPSPITEPYNNFYFYPGKLNIESLGSTGSIKNIGMEIKVLSMDNSPEDPGLPWIFGNSGTQGVPSKTPFVNKIRTAVWYHNKKPRFVDEIKIKLPLNLTEKHHILISLYHVNCKIGKKNKHSGEPIDQVFAYAAIPICPKGSEIIRPGNVLSVPVVSKAAVGLKYLEGDLFKADSDTSHRGSLEYHVNLVSSIYSSDLVLDDFLRNASGMQGRAFEEDALKTLQEWSKKTQVDKKEMVRFLPLLLNTLLSLVAHESKSVRNKAFFVLLDALVDVVEAAPQTAPQALQSYVDFIFDEYANNTSSKLYLEILGAWAGVNSQISTQRDICMRFSWFLGSLVIKSMALSLRSEGISLGTENVTQMNRSARFNKAVYDALSDFFISSAIAVRQYHIADQLSAIVAHRFTVHLAMFIGDLYGIIDRGQMHRLVSLFLERLHQFNDPTIASNTGLQGSSNAIVSFEHVATRCLLFKVLEQHPHYYTWNLPEAQDFKSGTEMVKIWMQRHFLTSSFLETFRASYTSQSSPNTRDVIIDTFIDMINRIDSLESINKISALRKAKKQGNASNSESDLPVKSKIACLYWPYVYFLLDKLELIETLTIREKKKALLPFIWLLKHTPASLISKYWERDSEKRIFSMFKLCSISMEVFELTNTEAIKRAREFSPPINPFFFLQETDINGVPVVIESSTNNGPTITGSGSVTPRSPDQSSSNQQSASSFGNAVTSSNGTLRGDSGQSNSLGNGGIVRSASSDHIRDDSPDAEQLGLLSSGMRSLAAPTASSKKGKRSRSPTDSSPITSSGHSTSNANGGNSAYNSMTYGTGNAKFMMKVQAFGAMLDVEVRRELNFIREMSLTFNDIFILFANNFPKALKRRDIFEQLWTPLLSILAHRQPVDVYTHLIESIYHLLPAFKVHFFAKSNSVCPELIANTLRHCNSESLQVRNCAVTLLIRIIQCNFIATNNIDRSRLQSTIAIIKIVGQSTSTAFERLTSALHFATQEILKGDAKGLIASGSSSNLLKSPKSANSTPRVEDNISPREKSLQIAKALADIEKKVDTILADNKKMKEYQFDPEMLADLYYNMSLHLQDSPDERITWLENLAEHHKMNNNLEESAQARVITAALVQTYLKALDRWETKMVPAFHLVAPNMAEESLVKSDLSALKSLKDEVCQSSIFSPEGFLNLLTQAVAILKQGGFYESCATAYRMILPIYYENDNYLKQKDCYAELQWLCQQILDENVMKQRIFSNYYRVVVYGAKIGPELNGVEFVYKELPTMRLIDFTEKIKRQFADKFGEQNVVLVPNSQTVNPAELDPSKVYMQLCNLEVYLTQEQLEDQNTGFKQHFGVKKFVMEQPFTKGGKSVRGGIEDQYIRRTVFTTEKAFPHLLKRSKVVAKEDIELTPIECAIALIEKRSRALRAELSASQPNIKNIQRELQGAVLTQVNAGPIAVIQSFLSEDKASSFPQKMRDELADRVMEFDRNVGFALRLNKAVMDDTVETQVTLQEELEKGAERLKQTIASLPIFAHRKDQRQRQDEQRRRADLEKAHKTLADESIHATPEKAPSSTIRPKISQSPNEDERKKVRTRATSDVAPKPSINSGSPKVTPIDTQLAKSPSATEVNSKALLTPTAKLPTPLSTPPMLSSERRERDKKEKEKEKEKKKTLKKASTTTSPTSSHDVNGSSSVSPPTTPKNFANIPIPTLLTSPTPNDHETSGVSPRARAASSALKSAEERAKEREERQKERENELRAKAKEKAATIRSPEEDNFVKSEREALERKQLKASIDTQIQAAVAKATLMGMSIPVALELAELGPLAKELKTLKEAITPILESLPEAKPRHKPSPANSGDKFAFFKAVCTNEIYNLKASLTAIESVAKYSDDLKQLKTIVEQLDNFVALMSAV